MARGWPQRLQRHPEPWPQNAAVIDGGAQGDGFRSAADVSGGGEALLQHSARKLRAVKAPVDIGMGQPVLGRIRARGQLGGDVDMGVDEARHDGGVGQVDDLGALGRHEPRFDRGDLAIVDEDRDLGARLGQDTVDQPSGMNHRVLRGRCRRERHRGEHSTGQQGRAAKVHGSHPQCGPGEARSPSCPGKICNALDPSPVGVDHERSVFLIKGSGGKAIQKIKHNFARAAESHALRRDHEGAVHQDGVYQHRRQ